MYVDYRNAGYSKKFRKAREEMKELYNVKSNVEHL